MRGELSNHTPVLFVVHPCLLVVSAAPGARVVHSGVLFMYHSPRGPKHAAWPEDIPRQETAGGCGPGSTGRCGAALPKLGALNLLFWALWRLRGNQNGLGWEKEAQEWHSEWGSMLARCWQLPVWFLCWHPAFLLRTRWWLYVLLYAAATVIFTASRCSCTKRIMSSSAKKKNSSSGSGWTFWRLKMLFFMQMLLVTKSEGKGKTAHTSCRSKIVSN